MALSQRTKQIIPVGLADKKAALELIAAVDASSAAVAANVTAIATVDATDLATAITLANANKAKINAILVALKAAGLMASS